MNWTPEEIELASEMFKDFSGEQLESARDCAKHSWLRLARKFISRSAPSPVAGLEEQLEAAEAVCRYVEGRICNAHGITPCEAHPDDVATLFGKDTWKLLTDWRSSFEPPKQPTPGERIASEEIKISDSSLSRDCVTAFGWLVRFNEGCKDGPIVLRDNLRKCLAKIIDAAIAERTESAARIVERGCAWTGKLEMVDAIRKLNEGKCESLKPIAT